MKTTAVRASLLATAALLAAAPSMADDPSDGKPLAIHVRECGAVRQAFPVDAYSVEMFQREGRYASVANTWAMEIEPGARFLYELSRPSGRLFQVEFDLASPVALPPTPWGHPEPD